jgi:hypothetical protein
MADVGLLILGFAAFGRSARKRKIAENTRKPRKLSGFTSHRRGDGSKNLFNNE